MSVKSKKPSYLQDIPRTLGIFVFLSGVLYWYDLVPELRTTPAVENSALVASPALAHLEDMARAHLTEEKDTTLPVRVVAKRVGLDSPITNPKNTDIASLDRALLSGAVVYPGSTRAGEQGNLLLFGHSSRLPVVKNPAFQAFNTVESLVVGDEVVVYTQRFAYIYRVRATGLTKADETVIQLHTDEPLLTLATCHTVGAKEDRFVTEAVFEKRVSL
jgi:hypothetical protein